MSDDSTTLQDSTEEVLDYLAGVPDDELVMVLAGAVRQTINATYVDATYPLVHDNDYEVAYVMPTSYKKTIKAIVAVPDHWRISVIPFGSAFDWQCEVRKYDEIVEYPDGTTTPFFMDQPVFPD